MALATIPKNKPGPKPKDQLDKLATKLRKMGFDPVEELVKTVQETDNQRIKADICLKLLDYLYAKAKQNALDGVEPASVTLNLGGSPGS